MCMEQAVLEDCGDIVCYKVVDAWGIDGMMATPHQRERIWDSFLFAHGYLDVNPVSGAVAGGCIHTYRYRADAERFAQQLAPLHGSHQEVWLCTGHKMLCHNNQDAGFQSIKFHQRVA